MIRPLILLSAVLLLLSPRPIHSQTEEERLVGDLLFIADEFASPAATGATYQAGAGWFTSGASLEKWKFEVSMHANALMVPSSRKISTISNTELNLLQVVGEGRNVQVPTAFGGPSQVVYAGEIYNQPFEFPAFEGANMDFIPHPFVQVTMGLPLETELTVRALPNLTLEDVMFGTYGAGIKHNLSQYLRFNEPEDYQFALIVAYSIFDVEYGFNPVDIQQFVLLDRIEVDADLWLFEALASKRYGNFEVFGALGTTNSTFGYSMDGSGPGLAQVNQALETLGDLEWEFKGDIGINYYLRKFKISGMVTAGKFFNTNLGLHFRI